MLPRAVGRRVLDVSCGQAGFAPFLQAAWGETRYLGIDISEAQVAAARAKYPWAEVRCLNGPDFPADRPVDVVFANGVFYLLGTEAPTLVRRLVSRMWELAEVAVAFHSPSTWAPNPEPGKFYAEPRDLLELGRSLTPWVVLRHDYHTRDFTIYLYRERRS